MKKENKKEIVLKCGCGCNNYFEITQWDNDETYIVMINANGKENLLHRIFQAIKHIFGRDLVSHELIFKKEQIARLKQFISKM